MLTVFAVPKAFVGSTAEIQTRAVLSWTALHPEVQVVLVGDEPGVAEVAARAGAEHLPTVDQTCAGTPRVNSAFAQVAALANHSLLCYVNADVLLGADLVAAVERVALVEPRFLLVGQTLDVDGGLLPDGDEERRRAALEHGSPRGAAALDWFVFPKGHLEPIPPFVVGRAGWDNWLVWRARQRGPVIDATDAVVAIHQAHGYGHVAGGKEGAYYGPEAVSNLRLAGSSRRIYTLHDASHRLTADLRIRRNLAATLRAGETLRKVKWKLGVR